jgi:competence protein ComGC
MNRFVKSKNGFSLTGLLLIFSIVSVLGLVSWFVYSKDSQRNISKSASSPTLSSRQASFVVERNKIIGPNGKQFTPYGVVIECPSMVMPEQELCTGDDVTGNSGSAMVEAASKDWHMNIVRFQVAQEHLFHSDGSVNTKYLNLINSLIKEANRLNMVAIITLQEEHYRGPAFPTASATTFWKFMSNQYKDNPDVFFDLYNEPRLSATAAGSVANMWNIWQNGGSASYSTGDSYIGTNKINYVGMQSIINTIRSQGSNNIIIAESPNYDEDLSGVPTHQLTGGNIAYGVEPNLKHDTTQAEQYKTFGQYTKIWPIMPEAFLDNYGSNFCDPNSPVDLPKLLNYLKELKMGLIFWSLQPGTGIVGDNLNQPTSYPAGSTSIASPLCHFKGNSAEDPNTSIGDGAIIKSFYEANSIQL